MNEENMYYPRFIDSYLSEWASRPSHKPLLLLSLTMLLACSPKEQDKGPGNAAREDARENALAVPTTISIYRYGDFPRSTAQELERRLKEYFPDVKLKEQALALPSQHYNKERNRYRGTGLYEDLARHRNGDAVIGLTDYVIFWSNELSPTYGIMGVSPVGTYKCVVSSKIPRSGQEQSDDNFAKLALHELGHAFGLNHCPDQHCFMVDAEHKMKFPQTTGFCEECRRKLNAQGWMVK